MIILALQAGLLLCARVQASAAAEEPKFSVVTAGQAFSCGVLTEGGHVECWGNGALPTESPSLEALEGKIPDENHESISGGGFHVCGLYYEGEERRSNVKAYCVASFEDGAPQDAGQLDIPLLDEGVYWREINAGGQHSCGIDSNRMPHCWGSEEGDRRMLGEYALMKHRHISAGGVATCGVLMDHTGYCVGAVPQGMLPTEYTNTKFSRLEAGGVYSIGLIKYTKELIKFGPGEDSTVFAAVESIPTEPPSGFSKSKTQQVGAGAAHICVIGRRTTAERESGLSKKGVWCAGTGGDEITAIPE